MRQVWAALLTFSGVEWLGNAIRVVLDNNYHPDKFTLVVAFVFTGFLVLKWAAEEWNAE